MLTQLKYIIIFISEKKNRITSFLIYSNQNKNVLGGRWNTVWVYTWDPFQGL